MLQMALLGSVQCEMAGTPVTGFVSAKAQGLLVYLAVSRRAQRRDTLAGMFWGDKADVDARLSLRVALSNLRRLVGEHLTIERESATFNRLHDYTLDVEMFEAGAGIQAAALSDADLATLQRAADRYQGDFMDGFYIRDAPQFEEWVLAQRARLRNLQLQVLYRLAAYYAQQRNYTAAVDYTMRSLAIEPWQEEAHYRLMLWLAECGRRSASLAQYETCRRMLAQEFRVQPSAETTALYRRIRGV